MPLISFVAAAVAIFSGEFGAATRRAFRSTSERQCAPNGRVTATACRVGNPPPPPPPPPPPALAQGCSGGGRRRLEENEDGEVGNETEKAFGFVDCDPVCRGRLPNCAKWKVLRRIKH
jgi:hypothetical protein